MRAAKELVEELCPQRQSSRWSCARGDGVRGGAAPTATLALASRRRSWLSHQTEPAVDRRPRPRWRQPCPWRRSPRRSRACRGSARARVVAAEQAPASNEACGGGPVASPAVEAVFPAAMLCTWRRAHPWPRSLAQRIVMKKRRTRMSTTRMKRRKLSVWVSHRFRRFGNTAERFRSDETIPFSLFSISCKKNLFC